MDSNPQHSAGSRDPVSTNSVAPPDAKQGTKRRIEKRLANVGAALSKGAGVFEFGPWKAALDDIGELTNAIRRVSSSREHGEGLVEDLEELLNEVCEHLNGPTSPAVKSSIEDFAKGVRKEIELLGDKRGQSGKIGRLEEATRIDDEVEECCRRVKMLLYRLGLNANVSVWKTVDEEKTDRLLRTLPDSPPAKYCSTEAESLGRVECTPNTRVELLEQLRTWACDNDAQKIYWLNGMAGTGKTTIAYSLCEWLQSIQKLGASFFCSQRLPECRDVNKIVPSISYRLSLFSVPFRYALASVLQGDKDAHNQLLRKQFEALFVQPSREAKDTFPANVVIVIDALDECDDQGGVAMVITTLLSHAAELPVKFFVTSRPEPKIVEQMRKKEAEGVRLELRLHELQGTVVRQDIATYLTAKLAPAGLSEAELSILVLQSGVLFIYAATVVRFLEFDDFSGCKQRLKLVLDASATSTNESDEALDELYTTILKTGLEVKGLTRAEKAARETVLRHVICAREPLCLDVMAGLLQADSAMQVSTALRPLQSVVSVSESGFIGALHESFPNYLLNPTRSGRFYCDPDRHHAQMAQQCFSLIKVPNPPFNICKLESSYMLDEEVPDINERVDDAISQALAYACRYWAAHLELANHSEDCSQQLYEFLSERLLLWMEVMNLKKQLWEGVDTLRKAQTWCKDAGKFVSMAVSGPVLRSTPHIYISVLAFWPKSQPVTKHYLPRFSGLVNVAGTITATPELTPATLDLSRRCIWELAYSPDGKHIAFIEANLGGDPDEEFDEDLDGHIDGDPNVAIWDISTGRCEASFGSTETRFRSIAFSGDGLHLILGCDDGTVCIWDMQTRDLVGDPLRCHSTDPILSIACSPDGDHIAAGSSDSNVYIWNKRIGQMVASLTSHTNEVRSVVYSPDGAYIVSGSEDETINIWSVHSSHTLRHELGCPTGAVYSVAFSPNGAHVASGSHDGSIHIWDARTGELVGELEEHVKSVRSICFSPSGLRLVSGSPDGLVYIWDPLRGQVVTELLHFRAKPIIWASYSLDGAQLMACSHLGTLYRWDSSTVEAAGQTCVDNSVNVERAFDTDLNSTPANTNVVDRVVRGGNTHAPRPADRSFEGHHGEVSALAYSPDGAYIVSGSDDCTLCIWDARTGRMVGQPLEGHTGRILSVLFSPDGTHVVSGSCDDTIRIWDVSTCTTFGAPLIGHTNWITSVSYSPDGAYIASGSYDKTIRIWDAYTGQMVGSPLIGHTDWVNSVSYSPCGVFLVSCSQDETIRVWSGTVGHLLNSLPRQFDSVTYSPDGLYIVSHSGNTLCVWDAYTSSMIGQPLKYGLDQLHSISYSSSGANLSLKCVDQAIHILHTCADRDSAQPFILDHRDPYDLKKCVFSPDGTHVASGYNDGTIRVSSTHIRQVLDAEMESQGNRPYAYVHLIQTGVPGSSTKMSGRSQETWRD
ncbi:hypothetical protein FRC09_020396 [Ceratobasidium sp. 395]|nr:hypothetical protein FRC09_020396 [Ceratobasidium sp. 395]